MPCRRSGKALLCQFCGDSMTVFTESSLNFTSNPYGGSRGENIRTC